MKARIVVWIVGAALLGAATIVGGVASVRLDGDTIVSFGGAGDVVTVPRFGEHGAHIVDYADGAFVSLTFPITNTGRLPVTVKAVRLTDNPISLLEPERVQVGSDVLPARLGPGQSASVTMTARRTNCRYFHEREIELFPAALVDVEVLGVDMTRRVGFDHDIVVHSPMIVGCPDRTLDRNDDVRPHR